MYELTAVCTRDRKCACVRYVCMYRSAAHYHEPLEIYAGVARVAAYRTREIGTVVCMRLGFLAVQGLRVHMWKHEKRAKWTVTWGS